MQDKIEKVIDLKAPRSRVWKALTDHHQFGQWFRVKIDEPFRTGEVSRGHMLYPGYEHVQWDALIEAIEPETRFAYRWHPYAVDSRRDYSDEERTTVEFRLEETTDGTRLYVTESGFSKIPEARRAEAFRANEGGWTQQMQNIAEYVATNS